MHVHWSTRMIPLANHVMRVSSPLSISSWVLCAVHAWIRLTSGHQSRERMPIFFGGLSGLELFFVLSSQRYVKGGCIWLNCFIGGARLVQVSNPEGQTNFVMPAENALNLSAKLSIKLSEKRVPSNILKKWRTEVWKDIKRETLEMRCTDVQK